MTESEFQAAVIALARVGGWRIHHGRAARTTQGWRTAITGHPGFPDLVLAHRRHGIVFAELKSDRGRLRGDQADWQIVLTQAGVRAVVWRPRDWPQIVATLTPGAASA